MINSAKPITGKPKTPMMGFAPLNPSYETGCIMDLRFTPDEIAFRDEVRAFMRAALPAPIRRKMVEARRLEKPDIVTWQRILNAKGWAVPYWPVAWGGTGWSAVKQYIFHEELQQAPAPDPLPFGVNMVGPVIIAFGSEAQKRRHLPRIANLDDWWCQGFSEPGAGSDLASLKTTARRDGDAYVVNGQKTWTTTAQYADWIFCLVRTDPAAKKQQGISFLLIDMKTPGITVRSIQTIDGGREVNEVFFDDVRVPVERTAAGTTPNSCSATSVPASPVSARRRRASGGSRRSRRWSASATSR